MLDQETLKELSISKEVLKKGSSDILPNSSVGSKLTFHFKTFTAGEDKKAADQLDDSRDLGQPFELLIGKSFKLSCWEQCVKTMCVGEVAQFHCPKSSVTEYPIVSQSLRDLHAGKQHQHSHTCGFNALKAKSCGYNDLDDLQKNMKDLIFEFELLKVENDDEYDKELWQMNPEEMLENIPKYHQRGNTEFKKGNVNEAEKNYAGAISCLKHLQMKERPGTEVWEKFDREQIPLLLNYAQCKLLQKDYTTCINNCTEVLEKIEGGDNVKALFKRGKAHAILLNEKECHEDFSRALQLDPTTKAAIHREVREMEKQMKLRDRSLSSSLRGMFDKV